MSKEYKAYYRSEIGLIKIIGTEDGITYLGFVEEEPLDNQEIHPILKECVNQLDEYFQGKRRDYTISL